AARLAVGLGQLGKEVPVQRADALGEDVNEDGDQDGHGQYGQDGDQHGHEAVLSLASEQLAEFGLFLGRGVDDLDVAHALAPPGKRAMRLTRIRETTLNSDATMSSTRPSSTTALKYIGVSASVNWLEMALAMV